MTGLFISVWFSLLWGGNWNLNNVLSMSFMISSQCWILCHVFYVGLFSLWLVEVATKSLVFLHKGITSSYMILCRQIQCSCEKCSYFKKSPLISEFIIHLDCCIRCSALHDQGVGKITCRLLLPRHTLTISLPPRIYPVASSWVMDIMDVRPWLSQVRRRTIWRRILGSGAVSQEKLSEDRMAKVPSARCELTRRRE